MGAHGVDMGSVPENLAGAALQTLLGATTAVCRGNMDSAAWLVADAETSGLAESVLAISPVVVKHILSVPDPTVLEDDPGLLACEFGLACRGGGFPEGSGSVGALCILAAVGRIDPWDPACLFALGFAAAVPLWGAIASTWFAAERLAAAFGESATVATERICMQVAARLAA